MSNFTDFISSGGGGSEINDQKAIYSDVNLITTESGEKWLKSGVLDTNISAYPNATVKLTGATYTSTNWSVASQITISSGITFDGTFFWLCDRNTNGNVYKYNASGAYQSVNFATSGDSENNGIFWNGSHFYIAGSNAGTIKRYNASGAIDSGWSIGSVGGCTGVAVIGTTVYVYVQSYNGGGSNANSDNVVPFTLTSSGGTAGTPFSTHSNTGGQIQDLTTDGTHLYATTRTGVVFQYTPTGTYTGTTFNVNALSSASIDYGGVAFKGTKLYSTNGRDNKVFEYNKVNSVGMPNIDTTLLNGTRYVRIL